MLTHLMIKKTMTITSLAILVAVISVAATMTMVQADSTGDPVNISIPTATPPSANGVPIDNAALEYDGEIDGTHDLTVDIHGTNEDVWIVLPTGAPTTDPIVVTIDDIQWVGQTGAIGSFECLTNVGATSNALFDKETLQVTVTPTATETPVEVHCDFVGFHGDIKKTTTGCGPIGIKEFTTTLCSFTITYNGVPANVIDTVPAEWKVTNVENIVDDCAVASANKVPGPGPDKQNKKTDRSATKINCNDVTEVDTTVSVETRESPGKGHEKKHGMVVYKPTSCGIFFLNDGAQAILLDGGVPVLGTLDGLPIVLDETVPIEVTADDSGPFDCDD